MKQFCGCWMTYPTCKEDCYWYEEWQDMVAHIPYCRCKKTEFIEPKDCENCEQYHSKYKPTNADRIRAMTDEELAEWLYIMRSRLTCIPDIQIEKCAKKTDCKKCYLEWVRKEADQ